ncbi:hypothetical protein BDC45DRAFT_515755 [Circinella umbellata]|nr:hypothetical protein BDC45DRAFT_515755 [Circinella umbellata]
MLILMKRQIKPKMIMIVKTKLDPLSMLIFYHLYWLGFLNIIQKPRTYLFHYMAHIPEIYLLIWATLSNLPRIIYIINFSEQKHIKIF